MKRIWILAIICFTLTLAACSSHSGDSNEDGSISDQDLALGDRYGEGSIPTGQENSMFKDVHFHYDSSQVKGDDQPTIKSAAKYLKENPSVRAELEGHCDKRGTAEYNMALGERRAKSVATMLVNFGAPASQISTISYGSEIPVDPASNETAYAKNRRVHFTLYKKGKK